MAISLKKNSGINLDKGLKNVLVTVTWETKMDIDIQAMVTAGGRASEDEDFVFYGNLEHPSGAVTHSGDIKDGTKLPGKVDKEYIKIALTEIPAVKDEIVISASIHNAINRGHHFGKAGKAVVMLIDADSNEHIADIQLDETLIGETCSRLAKFKKDGSIWRYEAMLEPVDSLERIILDAGLEVD